MIGSVVWQDPNGDGNVTVNEPAAFVAGYGGALKDIVLRLDPPISMTATLKVDVVPQQTGGVMPGGFSFQTVQVSFVDGQATIPGLSMSGSFPSVITNADYQFNWSIQFSGGFSFQQFRSTTHRLYLMHALIQNQPDRYRITTKRLDYVTALARGQSDLNAVIGKVQDGLAVQPGFNAARHIQTPNNVWAALDLTPQPPPAGGLDCESTSGIGAAQLQQLGYGTADVRKAYATGADPPGDTNATAPETRQSGGLTYTLGFDANVFEGYIYLSQDTDPPLAFTTLPRSERLGYTGCDVSPYNSSDNRIAFRVLTSTYGLLPVQFQKWYWIDQVTGNYLELPDQIPLPRNNCPAEENLP